MTKQQFETGKAPTIRLLSQGDVRVRGWNDPIVLINGEQFSAEQADETIVIDSLSDLNLYLPNQAFLTISEVAGDVSVKNLAQEMTIDVANGDVELKSLGSVILQRVMGDLSGRDINGALTAESVMGDMALNGVSEVVLNQLFGDLSIYECSGSFRINTSMGDLNLRSIAGDVFIGQVHGSVQLQHLAGQVIAEEVRGSIRLKGDLPAGKHYLTALGDIVIRWPGDSSLWVEATAPVIVNQLNLTDLSEEEGRLTGHIGKDGAHLLLDAKGRIILKEYDSDKGKSGFEDIHFEYDFRWDDLGKHIATEINQRMQELSNRMEQDFGPAFSSKIEKAARQAATRAERAAERAVRQAEKAARHAQLRAERHGWATPPAPAQKASSKGSKISEEEQLKILQMVEKGLISPEEASTLLEAIES